MKKILLTTIAALCSFTFIARAQWINSITVQPSMPTVNDTILVFADCMFSSGTCDQHTQGYFINGTIIDAWALHCTGMLTVICSHTDTFKINPLPAGNYKFRFQLDNGALPSPCTPGIVAGPHDSLSFVVSPITGTDDTEQIEFSLNPQQHFLLITNKTLNDLSLEMYDIAGKKIAQQNIVPGSSKLELPFAKGMYQAVVFDGGKKIAVKKIFVE